MGDTALLFDAIKDFDPRDPYGLAGPMSLRAAPGSLRGIRVAWLLSAGNPVDYEVVAITTAAVEAMASEGAIVETVQLDLVSLEKHFLVVLQTLLAARVGDNLERFVDRLDPTLAKLVRNGRAHSAVALHEATFAKTLCFGELQALFTRFDLLVSPTVSAPPLPIGMDVSGEIEIAVQLAGTVRRAWYPYTYPMNLTGHPALSMACGRSASGLPIGLQLAGRWYDDSYLLGIAALTEPLVG